MIAAQKRSAYTAFSNKQLILVLCAEYHNRNNKKVIWCIIGTYSRYLLVDNFLALLSNVKGLWNLTSLKKKKKSIDGSNL